VGSEFGPNHVFKTKEAIQKKLVKSGHMGLLVLLLVIAWGLTSGLCLATTQNDNRPVRSITMAAEYPGVEIPPDENVSMDLIFHNRGKSDENVDVWVSKKPEGWKTRIKTYRYTVTGVHVASGDDKTLTFEAEPGKDTPPGTYKFRVEAKTPDGKFKMAQNITVTIGTKEKAEKKDRGVKLTTSYPEIRGPSDATFEFSVEVVSKLDKDDVFNLFAQGPKGWEINFKPAYESKYISSLRLKADQSQTIAVEVKPAMMAPAGQYPINIRVSSGEAKGEAKLAVILTGTYGLEVGTANGLLSLDARRGKPANISFYVKNSGSAVNHDIKFMSFKPENWKVEFKPEKIDAIEPGGLKQIEMTITPYEDALVGDYSVTIKIDGEKASKTLEFRTTVKASAAWGWIGIGIIVAVIIGLFGVFRWLGRR
jgi:uncharacterized membrane protein